jgi:hypothetical protein
LFTSAARPGTPRPAANQDAVLIPQVIEILRQSQA